MIRSSLCLCLLIAEERKNVRVYRDERVVVRTQAN